MLSGAVGSYQVWGRLSQGGMSDVGPARHAHLRCRWSSRP
jgi:hypothetical protein